MDEQIDDVELVGRDGVISRVVQTIARHEVAIEGLRVRFSEADGRAVAQANARAAGRPVRVQVAAADFDQAVDDLAERLERRVLEAAACWSARPWPDTDDASVPSRIPPLDRVAGLRLLARVKRVVPVICPPEVAVAVMDRMDYPVHLFTDADTGMDAIVSRAGPTGYRLTRLRPAPPPPGKAVLLTVDPRPAPLLTADRAIARLEDTGLGHLFFGDVDTGRGRLLYRRFDGRYGLIEDGRPED